MHVVSWLSIDFSILAIDWYYLILLVYEKWKSSYSTMKATPVMMAIIISCMKVFSIDTHLKHGCITSRHISKSLIKSQAIAETIRWMWWSFFHLLHFIKETNHMSHRQNPAFSSHSFCSTGNLCQFLISAVGQIYTCRSWSELPNFRACTEKDRNTMNFVVNIKTQNEDL